MVSQYCMKFLSFRGICNRSILAKVGLCCDYFGAIEKVRSDRASYGFDKVAIKRLIPKDSLSDQLEMNSHTNH